MIDLAKFVLYSLGMLMTISVVINAVAFKWDNVLGALAILLCALSGIAIINWRLRFKRRIWRERMAELQGLDKCPISHDDLRELFEFLDRPNQPECRRRLFETYEFLESRTLEVDGMLDWLNANGAKCDCEVIMNTSDRFGFDVGFSPVDEAANA